MVAEQYAIENARASGNGGPSLSPVSPEYKQVSLVRCLMLNIYTYIFCTSVDTYIYVLILIYLVLQLKPKYTKQVTSFNLLTYFEHVI